MRIEDWTVTVSSVFDALLSKALSPASQSPSKNAVGGGAKVPAVRHGHGIRDAVGFLYST